MSDPGPEHERDLLLPGKLRTDDTLRLKPHPFKERANEMRSLGFARDFASEAQMPR